MPRPQPCLDWQYCECCGGVGQDANALFWCSACDGKGTVPARLFHYEVVSPVMTSGGWGLEPPEEGRCWEAILAPNARRARVLAVQSQQFREWVREARADGMPPFKGLLARRFVCEHGVCVGCPADEEEHPYGIACPKCEAYLEQLDREEVDAACG